MRNKSISFSNYVTSIVYLFVAFVLIGAAIVFIWFDSYLAGCVALAGVSYLIIMASLYEVRADDEAFYLSGLLRKPVMLPRSELGSINKEWYFLGVLALHSVDGRVFRFLPNLEGVSLDFQALDRFIARYEKTPD